MDKIHPIIDKPHTYELVDFKWHIDPQDASNSYVEMHLKKGAPVRKLRFSQPVEMMTESGFCGKVSGMEILDIRERQLEGLGVEVRNFEQDPGITFKARSVFDIE